MAGTGSTTSSAASKHRLHRLAPIVATILPDFPDLTATLREDVETDVTGYVAAQIAAMPAFLRLPYAAALLAFDLLPLALHGRRFAELAPQQRTAYLERWSDAPLAPMRDFVRLIRSTALLVYFDHPAVRDLLDADRQRASHGAAREAVGE